MVNSRGIVGAIAALSVVHACTIVAVTKEASADKTPLTAHTDDAGSGAADLRLVYVPAADYENGTERAVYSFKPGYPRVTTWQRGPHYEPKAGETLSEPLGYIPQVAHTYAYFDQDYGMMNEVQLSIAESTCAAKTVGWPSDVPYGYNLFGIAELTKLALERCDSARCAITTMGDAAVKYGFFSEDSGSPHEPGYSDTAEALAISDKYGETWIFHVMTGPMNASAVWAAQRVPPGHVAAVANGFIIRQLNLTDSANYMASSNVESFALSMGWWDPSAGPFDFTAAYNYHAPDGAIGPLYVGRRIWRILDWYAPSLKLNATLGESTLPTYPFSVLADKPVTLDSLFTLLKDHYEGTPFDMTKGLAAGPFGNPVRFDGPTYGIDGGWERSISMYRTMFSFVLQTNGNLPDHLGGTAWYGQGSPHGTVYIPFSCRQTAVPTSYLVGKQSEFHPESSWWVFDFVNNWSLLRFNAINAEVRAEANVWQARAVADQHSWRQKKDVTIATLQAANNAFADQVFQAWWALAWRLVSKFSDGYITTGEGEADTKTPGYPAAWLRQTEFFNWPGTTFHPPPGEVVTELAPAAHSAAGRSTWSSLALVVTGVAVGMWAQNARRSFVRRSQYERLL
ncbi:hypothetical protein, variant 1 [Aphanomyces invadans]|uniref:Peptidase n=1 Tax=Aphanomyces invadans TaxID=157072 RepID=A0A024UWS9_9STRA|nr:hypothetical protein, variant 1 [Aphanomyces invadans]ETW10400.1 hypothetical protein, variant 1 [Aphanomyces invadans]|eukprot:XP_008861811.1 hypothetical protein, variant 1 [Aphanomyces invadans]